MGLLYQPISTGLQLRAVYTSSTTFASPASSNINSPTMGYVMAIGGGGSGSAGSNIAWFDGSGTRAGAGVSGFGGGGSGYIGFGIFPLVGTITVTVGAGGAARSFGPNPTYGNDGGQSSCAGIFGYQGLGGGRYWGSGVVGSSPTDYGPQSGGAGGSGGGGGGGGGYNSGTGGTDGTGGVGMVGGTLGGSATGGGTASGFNNSNQSPYGGVPTGSAGTGSLMASFLPGGGGGGGAGCNFVRAAITGGAGGAAGAAGGTGGTGGNGGIPANATSVGQPSNGSAGTGIGAGGGGVGGLGGGKSVLDNNTTSPTAVSGAGTSGAVYVWY